MTYIFATINLSKEDLTMPIDDIMQQALSITRAQASVRPMSAAEVAAYAIDIAKGIKATLEPVANQEEEAQTPAIDPKHSIKENSITCLECGKTFKVLTIRHLRTHGLDAKSYKEKWNLKKSTSLACKSLIRVRRKKMHDMQLWTRRKTAKAVVKEPEM